MPAASPDPPRIELGGEPNSATLPLALARVVAEAVPAYLPRHRWFGDKARRIAGATLADLALVPHGPAWFALALADVAFEDGDPARYFLPFSVGGEVSGDMSPVATLGPPSLPVVDAFASPVFRGWLLRRLAAGTSQTAGVGAFAFRPGRALPPDLAETAPTSRLSGTEQSNTSVVYGDAAILKAFRKLQPGENPDIELGRFLTERAGFRHAPSLLGDVAYLDRDGALTSIAMLQGFVPSVADAWTWVLAGFEGAGGGAAPALGETEADLLGRRTGQLHAALAADPADPALAPEPVTEADARAWAEALERAVGRTLGEVRGQAGRLSPEARRRLDDLSGSPGALLGPAAGFRALVGTAKTRVHGDYHLGQVLRTHDADFAILDFEGEPSRPMTERRAKTSPLKDVAGMLRSFAYARAAAERAAAPGAGRPDLAGWERRVGRAFLAGYRAETVARGLASVPADPVAFDAALAAWVADKAIYELHYELNNRPDWLDLPLTALAPSTSDG